MKLIISIRSELYKTKRTVSFYLTLIMAALIPLIFLLTIWFSETSPELKKDSFNVMFTMPFQVTSFVIFPLFVVMICTLLPQIEYKNNAWKQVLASPQSKANVFVAKFVSINLLFLVFLVANHFFMLLLAVAAHFIKPELRLLYQPFDFFSILKTASNCYVSLLAIAAIQFWIGLRSKNFIVPIAVGLALWFTGNFMVLKSNSIYAKYFPYSFHIYAAFPEYRAQSNNIGLTSFGYTATFLLLGFVDFKRRRMSS